MHPAAAAAVAAYHLRPGQGVAPLAGGQFGEIYAELVAVGKGVGGEFLCLLPALFSLGLRQLFFVGVGYGEAYVAWRLLAQYGLAQEPVALRVQQGRGVDAPAVDHDGERAERAPLLAPDDGYGLPGFHHVADLGEVLGVACINGFEPVGVAHHDDIAVAGDVSR